MSSFEEIMRERGVALGEPGQRVGSNGCSYNPSDAGRPDGDCGQIARWHVRLKSDDTPHGVTIAACDSHIGIVHCAYGSVLEGLHEFGSACNLPDTWWVEPEGDGSLCMTVERGIELGYLAYVEKPDDLLAPVS